MRPTLAITALAVSWLAFAPAGVGPSEADRAKSLEFQKKALAAYRAKDWPGFLENARQASALRPGEPRILYTLACAQARNGRAAEAAKILEGLIDRTLDFGSATDEDFAAVRDGPEFAGVRRGLAELRRPVGGSAVAFRLPEKDLLTEGVAYDPASKAFFVSSVHRRKIIRRAADGTMSDFVRGGQDGIQGVLALAVDAPRKRLLACSAALPQMAGYEKRLEGASALYAFDLATGKLLRRDSLSSDGKPHACNDLLVEADGDVLVTDSLGSGIYRFRAAGGPVETVVPPGVFRSPQGIGHGPGGRIYVADWGYGLYWIEGGKRHEVAGPADAPLFGIDGLVASSSAGGRVFYVTQNGLAPQRVARLELDAAGDRVVAARILDMNDPEATEPTLLTLVEKDLYVIGKSQWAVFDEQTGAFDPGKLQEPVVVRIATE
jgi:sugar lactone lactonase YvrE